MNVSATGAAGRIRLHLRTIASRSCSAIGRRLLRGGPGWSCRWRRRAIARRCSGSLAECIRRQRRWAICRRVWARSWKWSRRMRWKRSADRRPSRWKPGPWRSRLTACMSGCGRRRSCEGKGLHRFRRVSGKPRRVRCPCSMGTGSACVPRITAACRKPARPR